MELKNLTWEQLLAFSKDPTGYAKANRLNLTAQDLEQARLLSLNMSGDILKERAKYLYGPDEQQQKAVVSLVENAQKNDEVLGKQMIEMVRAYKEQGYDVAFTWNSSANRLTGILRPDNAQALAAWQKREREAKTAKMQTRLPKFDIELENATGKIQHGPSPMVQQIYLGSNGTSSYATTMTTQFVKEMASKIQRGAQTALAYNLAAAKGPANAFKGDTLAIAKSIRAIRSNIAAPKSFTLPGVSENYDLDKMSPGQLEKELTTSGEFYIGDFLEQVLSPSNVKEIFSATNRQRNGGTRNAQAYQVSRNMQKDVLDIFSFLAQSAGNPVDLQRKILGIESNKDYQYLTQTAAWKTKIFPQIQSALQVQLHQGLLSETQLRGGSMGTVNPSFRPYGELFGSDNRNPTQTAAKRTPAPFKGQPLGRPHRVSATRSELQKFGGLNGAFARNPETTYRFGYLTNEEWAAGRAKYIADQLKGKTRQEQVKFLAEMRDNGGFLDFGLHSGGIIMRQSVVPGINGYLMDNESPTVERIAKQWRRAQQGTVNGKYGKKAHNPLDTDLVKADKLNDMISKLNDEEVMGILNNNYVGNATPAVMQLMNAGVFWDKLDLEKVIRQIYHLSPKDIVNGISVDSGRVNAQIGRYTDATSTAKGVAPFLGSSNRNNISQAVDGMIKTALELTGRYDKKTIDSIQGVAQSEPIKVRSFGAKLAGSLEDTLAQVSDLGVSADFLKRLAPRAKALGVSNFLSVDPEAIASGVDFVYETDQWVSEVQKAIKKKNPNIASDKLDLQTATNVNLIARAIELSAYEASSGQISMRYDYKKNSDATGIDRILKPGFGEVSRTPIGLGDVAVYGGPMSGASISHKDLGDIYRAVGRTSAYGKLMGSVWGSLPKQLAPDVYEREKDRLQKRIDATKELGSDQEKIKAFSKLNEQVLIPLEDFKKAHLDAMSSEAFSDGRMTSEFWKNQAYAKVVDAAKAKRIKELKKKGVVLSPDQIEANLLLSGEKRESYSPQGVSYGDGKDYGANSLVIPIPAANFPGQSISSEVDDNGISVVTGTSPYSQDFIRFASGLETLEKYKDDPEKYQYYLSNNITGFLSPWYNSISHVGGAVYDAANKVRMPHSGSFLGKAGDEALQDLSKSPKAMRDQPINSYAQLLRRGNSVFLSRSAFKDLQRARISPDLRVGEKTGDKESLAAISALYKSNNITLLSRYKEIVGDHFKDSLFHLNENMDMSSADTEEILLDAIANVTDPASRQFRKLYGVANGGIKDIGSVKGVVARMARHPFIHSQAEYGELFATSDNAGLDYKSMMMSRGLMGILNGDVDGDHLEVSLDEQVPGFSELDEKDRQDIIKSLRGAASVTRTASQYVALREEASDKASNPQANGSASAAMAAGLYNKLGDKNAEIAASSRHGEVGLFSNKSTAFRNALSLLQVDEEKAHDLIGLGSPDKTANSNAINAALSRAFFQNLEQDAISSKKVRAHFLAQKGIDSSGMSDAQIEKLVKDNGIDKLTDEQKKQLAWDSGYLTDMSDLEQMLFGGETNFTSSDSLKTVFKWMGDNQLIDLSSDKDMIGNSGILGNIYKIIDSLGPDGKKLFKEMFKEDIENQYKSYLEKESKSGNKSPMSKDAFFSDENLFGKKDAGGNLVSSGLLKFTSGMFIKSLMGSNAAIGKAVGGRTTISNPDTGRNLLLYNLMHPGDYISSILSSITANALNEGHPSLTEDNAGYIMGTLLNSSDPKIKEAVGAAVAVTNAPWQAVNNLLADPALLGTEDAKKFLDSVSDSSATKTFAEQNKDFEDAFARNKDPKFWRAPSKMSVQAAPFYSREGIVDKGTNGAFSKLIRQAALSSEKNAPHSYEEMLKRGNFLDYDRPTFDQNVREEWLKFNRGTLSHDMTEALVYARSKGIYAKDYDDLMEQLKGGENSKESIDAVNAFLDAPLREQLDDNGNLVTSSRRGDIDRILKESQLVYSKEDQQAFRKNALAMAPVAAQAVSGHEMRGSEITIPTMFYGPRGPSMAQSHVDFLGTTIQDNPFDATKKDKYLDVMDYKFAAGDYAAQMFQLNTYLTGMNQLKRKIIDTVNGTAGLPSGEKDFSTALKTFMGTAQGKAWEAANGSSMDLKTFQDFYDGIIRGGLVRVDPKDKSRSVSYIKADSLVNPATGEYTDSVGGRLMKTFTNLYSQSLESGLPLSPAAEQVAQSIGNIISENDTSVYGNRSSGKTSDVDLKKYEQTQQEILDVIEKQNKALIERNKLENDINGHHEKEIESIKLVESGLESQKKQLEDIRSEQQKNLKIDSEDLKKTDEKYQHKREVATEEAAAAMAHNKALAEDRSSQAAYKEDTSNYGSLLSQQSSLRNQILDQQKRLAANPKANIDARTRLANKIMLEELQGQYGDVTGELGGIEQKYLNDPQFKAYAAEMQKKIGVKNEHADALRNIKENGATTLFDNLKTSFHGLLNQFVQFGAAYKILGMVREGIQNVVTAATNLDKAMTNIRIVTGDSREEAVKYMKSLSGLAGQLSVTTQETANAANDWFN